MAVSKSIQDELKRIKENISISYFYFKDNVNRYHDYRRFVFDTSINNDQKAVLQSQNKPVIEFNILEAYISRLLGEFAKHEPSIEVTPSEGVPVSNQVIETVEGFIRHIVYEANKNSMSYEVYKDLLSGGFSVIKVWTEYASPMSMKQVIRTARAFDPTMCGFDPMARFSQRVTDNTVSSYTHSLKLILRDNSRKLTKGKWDLLDTWTNLIGHTKTIWAIRLSW